MREILKIEHPDILDSFLDSLTKGGIVAGEIMVAGVIAEEEAARVLSKTAHHIEAHENASEFCEIDNMDEVVDVINFIDGIQDEYTAFESRRNYAQHILKCVINNQKLQNDI